MAVTIEAQKRDESKNPRQLRAEGFLPATIYGKGKDSVSIQLDKRIFVNTYKNNKDAVYELVVGKDKYNASIQNFQIEAGTQNPMNIEFKLV